MSTITNILAALAVVMFLVSLLLFMLDQLLVAGVLMLAVSLTIYYRETRL